MVATEEFVRCTEYELSMSIGKVSREGSYFTIFYFLSSLIFGNDITESFTSSERAVVPDHDSGVYFVLSFFSLLFLLSLPHQKAMNADQQTLTTY
jgi:hypothetical protein